MRVVLLLFIVLPSAFGNTCVAAASGNWNSSATWTSCGSTYPGDGDSATISGGYTVTITADVGTSATGLGGSITISGSNSSKLVTDGAGQHTIWFHSTGTTGGTNMWGILLQQGALDFSAATAANYVALKGSGAYPVFITHTTVLSGSQTATLRLAHTYIPNCGTGTYSSAYSCINLAGDSATAMTVAVSDTVLGGNAVVHYTSASTASASFTGNVWYERTGGYGLHAAGGDAVTFTDNTDWLPQSSGSSFWTESNYSCDGATVSRNVVYYVGYYGIGLTNTNTGTTSAPCSFDYNVAAFDNSVTYGGVGVQIGSGSASGTDISYNMGHNCGECINPQVGTAALTVAGNWFTASYISTTTQQGLIIVSGHGSTAWSVRFTGNMCSFDTSTTFLTSTDCILHYNGMVGTWTLNTLYMPPSLGAGPFGMALGDGGSYPAGTGSVVHHNTMVGYSNGYEDDAANTYGTSGPSGVGVYANDVFVTSGTGYFSLGTSTNYGTGHPNSAYGDTTADPRLVNPQRRYPDADAFFGGPGTEAHLMQGLAACASPLFAVLQSYTCPAGLTTRSLYSYLTAGFTPLTPAVAGKGAVAPAVVGAWLP